MPCCSRTAPRPLERRGRIQSTASLTQRLPRNKMQRQKQNATKTIDELRVTATRTLQREEAKRLKIQALGIDYSFEGASRAAKAFLEANPVNA